MCSDACRIMYGLLCQPCNGWHNVGYATCGSSQLCKFL